MMTDAQAERYIAEAPDAVERRLRSLEVGMLRHTTILERLTEAVEKLTAKMGRRA